MPSRRRLAVLVTAFVFAPLAAHAQPVAPAGYAGTRLQPTTTSEAARTAFRAALLESHNVGPDRARARIGEAVSADPKFGLARAYQAVIATGLTATDREKAIGDALATMGSASLPEVLLALYWRENAAGRGPAALPMLRALSQMVPADTQVGYIQLGTDNAGKTSAEQVVNIRRYVQTFPAYAPAYNSLAYALWFTGERDASLATVQEYTKLAPTHPNSHDSYADMLMLVGRPQDAMQHVQRELELDPAFGGAHSKAGAIHMMMGDLPAARASFAKGLEMAATPGARFEHMTWNAVTYAHARDAKGALREWDKVVAAAKAANAKNAEAIAHLRIAVVEAYLGNRKTVGGHIDAASSLQTPNANHFALQTMAYSRAGDATRAKASMEKFVAAAPDAPFAHALAAILALDAKDLAAAEAALGRMTVNNAIHKALKAEVMTRRGQKKEAAALRQEVLASSLKLENNNNVDFAALVARMRVGKL